MEESIFILIKLEQQKKQRLYFLRVVRIKILKMLYSIYNITNNYLLEYSRCNIFYLINEHLTKKQKIIWYDFLANTFLISFFYSYAIE